LKLLQLNAKIQEIRKMPVLLRSQLHQNPNRLRHLKLVKLKPVSLRLVNLKLKSQKLESQEIPKVGVRVRIIVVELWILLLC